MALEEPAENVLKRGADEEELLAQPQRPAGIRRVVGIEHARESLGVAFASDRPDMIAAAEMPEIEVFERLRGPQPDRVHQALTIARNLQIMGDPGNFFDRLPDYLILGARILDLDMSPIGDAVRDSRAAKLPGIALHQPIVGTLGLPAVFDDLLKHAGVVADAVAIGRIAERGQRIHEARRETAETAITQSGVVLFFVNRAEIDVERRQG